MIFFRKKRSSDAGLNAKHVEKIARCPDPVHTFRVGRAVQIELIAFEGRDIFESTGVGCDELKLEAVQRCFVKPKIHLRRRNVPNRKDPLGVRKRERLQQDTVHNRKNSDAGAHSESEDSHRQRGEPRILSQSAKHSSNFFPKHSPTSHSEFGVRLNIGFGQRILVSVPDGGVIFSSRINVPGKRNGAG
jgi:hypothetical protein